MNEVVEVTINVGDRVEYVASNENAESKVAGWTGTVVNTSLNFTTVKWDQAQPHDSLLSWYNGNLRLI